LQESSAAIARDIFIYYNVIMSRAVAYFSLVMSLFFIFMGLIFPFRRPPIFAASGAPDYVYYLIGAVLLAYGIFRFWRAYKMLKER
jgi:hypothetical protein